MQFAATAGTRGRRSASPSERRSCERGGGFLMELSLSDWCDQYIFASGDYEDATAALVGRLIGAGQTFIDVGANIGFFSLQAAQIVGTAGTVMAFEPVSELRSRLDRNSALNRFTNIRLCDVGLSDRSEEVTLFTGPPGNSGLASLRWQPDESRARLVKTDRFDDIWNIDKPIQLIKIDVEGAEAKVLRGMTRCIDRWSPDLIVEVTDNFLRQCGDSAEALCGALVERGYAMYVIASDGLERVARWNAELPEQFNALFTKRATPPAAWLARGLA